MAAVTDGGLAAALARRLAETDPGYRPLAQRLAQKKPVRPRPAKKKNTRARKPAVPET